MAEGHSGPGPVEDLLFIVGILVVLVVLWFAMGGYKKSDIRGIFVHPPAPVGTGGSYGPALGSTTITQ